MEFSDVYVQTGGLCEYSPDGVSFAVVADHRLIVRNGETMALQCVHQCKDKVSSIEWSSDSLYILCAMNKRGLVEVWSIEDPEWTCRIDEGSAGLMAARWSPDGRHVLTSADFQLRTTVWSLVSQQVHYLKFPKFPCKVGCAFSGDGAYMAVLERSECKDRIGIFACKTWDMVGNFAIATTDATDLSWSPDGRAICVADAIVNHRVCVYQPDGRELAVFSAYEHALGVKTVAWSPSSQLLAIGSYDQKVRLLNNLTWGLISEFQHGVSASGQAVAYREVETQDGIDRIEPFSATGGLHAVGSRYDVDDDVRPLESVRADPEKPFPQLGVGLLEFSPDSRFFATRNDNMPTVVWVWNVAKLRTTAVLRHIAGVRTLKWHPHRNLLVMATGGGSLYFWSSRGALCAQIPTERAFSVQEIKWHPNGDSILLFDKKRVCVAFTATGLEVL